MIHIASDCTPQEVSQTEVKLLQYCLTCRAAAIHGDMDQHSRMVILTACKAGKHHILVATDVAARGLNIKSVINYDAALQIALIQSRQKYCFAYRAAAIHGDMDQHSRMAVLNEYKAGKHHVLVATDVAARGLDIKSIKSVINYDAAKEIDTHVHRIGRTGRAGDKEGIAYTLITPYESRFAGMLQELLVKMFSPLAV